MGRKLPPRELWSPCGQVRWLEVYRDYRLSTWGCVIFCMCCTGPGALAEVTTVSRKLSTEGDFFLIELVLNLILVKLFPSSLARWRFAVLNVLD